MNQGILQSTGFVNSSHINQSGVWSLGLLQMDFFYRRKLWYAGQFVRKVIPKFKLSEGVIHFVTTALNTLKNKLLTVLVRNVDDTFLSQMIQLPSTEDGKIDFVFMNEFISKLISFKTNGLNAYLSVTGLKGYELTDDEKKALDSFSNLNWKEWELTTIFNVNNTHNILSSEVIPNSGKVPYLSASSENNAVGSYIQYKNELLEKGNCIFIGGKTFVVSYQKGDFFSNDSHNLALYSKGVDPTENNQLFMSACVYKGLNSKYSWGNSISGKKIQSDVLMLPTYNKTPDYEYMEIFIRAVKKLVIKDVVLRANEIINATTQVLKH